MKKTTLGLMILLLFATCKTSKKQVLDQNVVTAYAQKLTPDALKKIVYTLADDSFEGRETGKKGQKMAANYIKHFYENQKISSPLGEANYFQSISSSYFDYQFKATENVVAWIKGTTFPDEVIVISAHYDHLGINARGQIYNGADDDASGTAAIMQIAKIFKTAKDNGLGPKRTLLFLHFTGEEKGLLGSQYYTENPILPLSQTIANLNTDMIGRVDKRHQYRPSYIYLIGSNRLSSQLDSIINQENTKHTKLNLDYKYNSENDPQRLYYRSDHYNFAKHNIPVNFFFSGLHEDYHKITDTPDKINYDLMSKRARLIFYTAWQLANRDKAIEVDKD